MAKEEKLTGPWRKLHGAVWLFGLAVLVYMNWWWSGILVLVGLSSLVEALILIAVPGGAARSGNDQRSTPRTASEQPDARHKTPILPHQCPKCGAPIPGSMAQPTTLDPTCAYCGARLPHHLA
jgi:hypothetical protein